MYMYYGMNYKCTDLIASLTCYFYQQNCLYSSNENLHHRVNYCRQIIIFINKIKKYYISRRGRFGHFALKVSDLNFSVLEVPDLKFWH